jgi:hypothetical protein
MKKGRQSKNVEDKTSYGVARKVLDGWKTNITSMISGDSLEVTPQRKQAAKALGLTGSLAGLQNAANKAEARRRTRFTPATDSEVVNSLTRRKK